MFQRAVLLVVSVIMVTLLSVSIIGRNTATENTATTPPAEIAQPTEQPSDTIITLTEEDFKEVADSLGVEVAAIKAVVEIEAGRTHEGFSSPGKPLINFDLTMFRRFATRHGVNLSKYSGSHSVVFNSHRSSQIQANRRFDAAKSIHRQAAIEGTFWGMFQIGGFNWKLCGAESLDDFVDRMSRSERDQLELFAAFITKTGLVKHLKAKNWAAFARGYNGPSYAKRGYHTRMASAYAKHKNAETQTEPSES